MCASLKIDDITIRHFQPEDLEQVQFLFRQGMLSLVPVMVKELITLKLTSVTWDHPYIMTAPLLAVGWQHAPWSLVLRLYTGVVLTVKLAWLIFYYFKSRKDFRRYIQSSIDTDLSNIPSLYQTNGGCFLVATANKEERVVGMVGGEYKEEKSNKRIYELRRMSVDPRMRGLGIGKRLVRRLEKELDQLSMIFLTCSNLQPPAQALYKGQRFQLKSKSSPGNSKSFEILRFEKDFTE